MERILFFVREKATGKRVKTSDDIYSTVKELGEIDQEIVLVIGYDRKNKEIFREITFKGGLSESVVDCKILFRHLLIKNCSSFVLVHNHPSGEIEPSPGDIELTRKVKEAGRLVDIELLDHIIVGDSHYYSFADSGRLY